MIALPCARCRSEIPAGYGSLCVKCGGRAPRLPSHSGPVTPMNEAAREQMDANGETYDRAASLTLQRFFKLP